MWAALPAAAGQISETERVALQAAMVQHIDRQTIDGIYPWLNLPTGEVANYSPAKSHPMILKMGETYVLCTDFKDMKGASTNVDFYLARKGKSFAVMRTEIGNRGPLMDLMKAGKAEAID